MALTNSPRHRREFPISNNDGNEGGKCVVVAKEQFSEQDPGRFSFADSIDFLEIDESSEEGPEYLEAIF